METDALIIKQEKGQDSWVNVEEGFIRGYPDDKKTLIFTTDQSLLSNSDRAWNVEKAIREYANERGYGVQKPYEDKFKAIAVYDEDYHSQMLEFKLRNQIKNHPRFLNVAKDVKHQHDMLNKQYGKHINELEHLIALLEKSLDAKFKEVAVRLINEQKQLIDELGREGIKDYHLFANKYPLISIGPDYYYKLTDNIPDNLDDILALLD